MANDNDIRRRATDLWHSAKGFFSLTPFLIPQAEAEESIRDGISFRGTNMLILVIAIFIASLGLNTNSTAVIIGAMLISPLMGPIIGMGLGAGIHDFELIKRSARNLAMAALFSLLASTIYFLISPVNEGHSELLARTSPTIYDVFIALFGGAAGIVAVGSRSKGNVLPGVAIATALMPPLCTAGYGLATWQFNYFFGALYLFIINSIYIGFATLLGVKLMKYTRTAFVNEARAKRVRKLITVLVTVTAIPAIYLTYTMIRDNTYQQRARHFVESEFKFPDTRVLSFNADIEKGQRELTVTLIGRALPQDSLQLAMSNKLAAAGLQGTQLTIVQGTAQSSMDGAQMSSSVKDIYEVAQSTINRQTNTIDSLLYLLHERAVADTVAAAIAPEVRAVFPQVEELAIVNPTFANIATGRIDTLHVALVKYSTPLNAPARTKLSAYLAARLRHTHVELIDIGSQLRFNQPDPKNQEQ